MHPDNREALRKRVVQAAEAALVDHGYVSALDVLTGMRLLSPVHLESGRKGRLDFLQRLVQGNLKKISLSMSCSKQPSRQVALRIASGPTICCRATRRTLAGNSRT